MAKSFYAHFRDAMASVGLPAPDTLWGTSALALTTIKALLQAITSVGARATATELLIAAEAGFGAGAGAVVAEGLLVGVSGAMASFYLGACIGAFVYATQQSAMDHWQMRSAADSMTDQARRLGISIPHRMRMLA